VNESWSRPFRYLVGTLVILAFLLVLWWIRRVLEPLVVAAFLAYVFDPLVVFFVQRTKWSRQKVVNLVYFTLLALLVALPATLVPTFIDDIQLVVQDLLNVLDQIRTFLGNPIQVGRAFFNFRQLADALAQFQNNVLYPLPDEALKLIGTTSRGAFMLLIVLIATYYFMRQWPRIRDGFITLFPAAYHEELRELYRRVRWVWKGYLRGTLVLMVVVGVVFTIAWTIIGIPGALLLGGISGILTLIPDIGPFIAALLAIAVALLEGSSWIPLGNIWVALIVLAVYLVLINIKGFWLRPYIFGRSVRMNESLVLIAILLATALWGVLGALLIVPVLASALVIGDYLRRRVLGLTPFPESEPLHEEGSTSTREGAKKESHG
jgi:predicted PurR-regulated permease PerM